MKIIGKSIIKDTDLMGKSKINKYIEIQLFNDFENNSVIDLYEQIININNIDVTVVHVPIIQGNNINIEFVGNNEDYNKIKNSIMLASKLGEYYNHNIKVVIHTAFAFEDYKKFPSIYKQILLFFDEIFYKYQNIEFCFENVIPFEYLNGLHFRSGFLFDNVKLANFLNKYYNTDRFGTVLDTCHALTSIRFLNQITEHNITLEDFFKENKEYIKLIHLCNVKNLGLNEGEHGIKFENKEDMFKIMELYKKYNYNADITIEITENDYIKNDNFKQNLNMLNEIRKELNI